MIVRARFLTGLLILVLFCAGPALAASKSERDQARKKLEPIYGKVTPLTLLDTLIPPNPEHLRLFLAAGIPADEVTALEVGDQVVSVSPLQYVLMHACESNETAEVVKVLLDGGADPNRRDPRDGGTPLMRSSSCGRVMELLLKAGADPNLRTTRGDTALGQAILFGTPETMRILVKGGADVQSDREKLLKQAARSADKLAVIRQALGSGSGAKPSASRSFGDALFKRDLEGLRAALDSGKWTVEPIRNDPPLIYLVNRCKKDEDPKQLVAVVQLLLERGAKVNDPGPALQENPLHAAAKQCPVEAVRALLAAGANPNAANSVNQVPLLGAVMFDRADVVDALMSAGAKVDRESRFFAKTKPEIEKLLKKRR